MNRTLGLYRRICLPVAILLLAGLCLIAGGTAHESALLTRIGVGLFGVGAVCLSIALLLTYWVELR